MGLRCLVAKLFEPRRPAIWMPALALMLTVSACTQYRVAPGDGGGIDATDSGSGGSGVGGTSVAAGGATGNGGAGHAGSGGSGTGGRGTGGSGGGGSGTGGVRGLGGSGSGGIGTGGVSGLGGIGTGGSGTGGVGTGGNGTGGVTGLGGSGAGGAGGTSCTGGNTDTCSHALGALGSCAAGTSTCTAGKWGPCSIQPKTADACDIGNDDTCDGVPNTGCICDGFSPPADHPNPTDYDTSMAGIVLDKATGRMWERNPPSTAYTQPDAAGYCTANRLGGFSNWRVPTVTELVSIFDLTVSALPLINSTVFPNTADVRYWTSTLLAGDSTKAWDVLFTTGEIQFALITTGAHQVRCVR